MNIDRNEIVRLTEEYGGVWGIQHTRRLLKFIFPAMTQDLRKIQ